MEHRWNEIDRGKLRYSGGRTCPNATLSTTNPTWTDPGSNPDLRGERQATDRLSHGTAIPRSYHCLIRISLHLRREMVENAGLYSAPLYVAPLYIAPLYLRTSTRVLNILKLCCISLT
jgi:hypothetical protein